MANCIISGPPGPFPSETHSMMAHDHGQAAFIKMETQGEGNYASTVFSNADQQTVQGLTLPPHIQSSDQWFLDDTAVAFGEQDLDAILGPLQSDPLAVEDQTSNSDIHDLINDEYYQMEPPEKKRKLSREASKEPSLPLKPSETAREQAVNPIPIPISKRPSQPIPMVDQHSPNSQTSLTTNSRAVTAAPTANMHALTAHKPPFATAASIYPSSYNTPGPSATGDRAVSIVSASPLDHGHVVTRTTETRSFSTSCQGGLAPTMNAHDEEPEVQATDDFDDDGSLFGDYVSSREGSAECSPTVDSLPSQPTEEIERCTLRVSKTAVPTPVGVPTAGTYIRALPNPDLPIPSVERTATSIPSHYFHQFRVSLNQKIRPGRIHASTPKLGQDGVRSSSYHSLNDLEWEIPQKPSVPKRNQNSTPESSALLSHGSTLLLLIVAALTTPDNLESLADSIKSARDTVHGPSQSPNIPTPIPQIPVRLEHLLDGLHQKFNHDSAFRTSAVTWLTRKMTSTLSFTDASGSTILKHLHDIGHLERIDEALDALGLERSQRESEWKSHKETVDRLQTKLDRAEGQLAESTDELKSLRIEVARLRALHPED